MPTPEAEFKLFDAISTAVLVHDAETLLIIHVNEATCTLFELTHEQLKGHVPEGMFSGEPPYDRAGALACLVACRENGSHDIDFHLRTRSGKPFWSHVSLRLTEIADRKLIVVNILDISQEKAAKLREIAREEDFRLLFDQMNEGVALHAMVYDPAGQAVDYRILEVNQKYTEQTGLGMEQARGCLATEVYGTPTPPYLQEFGAVAETGVPYQFETYFPPLKRHFLISVASMRQGYFATIFFDVTARKQAEQELTDSRNMIASIAGAIPDFLYVLDLGTMRFVYHNREMQGKADPVGSTLLVEDPERLFDLFPPEDREELISRHQLAIRELPDKQIYSWEHRLRTATGGIGWINHRVMVFGRNGRGKVSQVIGVAENITERKMLENELDKLFRNSIDLIVMADSNGHFRKVSPSCSRVLGWTEKELMAKPYLEFVHPDDQAKTIEVSVNLDGETDLFALENRYRCKNGSYRWLSWNYFREGEKFYAIARDVTDRVQITLQLQELNKSLEKRVQERSAALMQSQQMVQQSHEQLIATEKLVQLGELVSFITHEVNTPLGLSITAASFLQSRAKGLQTVLQSTARDPAQALSRKFLTDEIGAMVEASELVLSNANRANDLIGSFKQQSVDRAGNLHRRFRLADIIEQTLFSLKPRLQHTPYEIKVDCDPAITIESYPGDISQILINFVVNSLMHGFDGLETGTISIAVATQPMPASPLVRIRYQDDGKGIPVEARPHIFEPFFTTKRGKGGSGLGLSIVESLVSQKLGGSISLDSQMASTGQRGYTAFTILLPVNLPIASV